jgi:hypothetical protein
MSAPALDLYSWEYLSMQGIHATCIEVDPTQPRVFVGTYEGFHYLDQETGTWTEWDEEGWIGRSVYAIGLHPEFPERVITGRMNAWFKGYLEISEDLGATSWITYDSDGGWVTGLLYGSSKYYACTWSDISPGEFLRSGDGGETWELLLGHGHYTMTSLDEDNGLLYLSGDAGVVRSWDEGETWESISGDLPPGYGVYDVHCAFPGGDAFPEHCLFASLDTGVYRSFSSGNWEPVLDHACRELISIPRGSSWLSPSDFLVAVTFSGQVFLSGNLGESWDDFTMDLPGQAIDASWSSLDQSLYVATASQGTFRLSGLITPSPDPAASITLQAWPNPFNPLTRISYSMPGEEPFSLDIYDAEGRHVCNLFRGLASRGQGIIDWKPQGLASGVYLARIKSRERSRSLKLLLVR